MGEAARHVAGAMEALLWTGCRSMAIECQSAASQLAAPCPPPNSVATAGADPRSVATSRSVVMVAAGHHPSKQVVEVDHREGQKAAVDLERYASSEAAGRHSPVASHADRHV